MSANDYFTCVVDFGKTNKKVIVYDRELAVRGTRRKTFEPVTIDGYRCDDISGAMGFVLDALRELGREFSPIRAISFTTHGATFLTVDRHGELVFPPVSYDMEPPPGTHDDFYRTFGSKEELQASTSTPPLPLLINPGIGIFFLARRDPERFRRVAKILFLPQYLGYLMTGKTCADPTYIGCHTYLWDLARSRPSSVAEGLGVAGMIDQPLRTPWEVQGTLKPELARSTGLPADCVVTCGIHDSNASLLPYLLKEPGDDFVLNSTGTWCVAMSPGGRFPLAPEEIGREVFFNLSAFGRPVKTTIFRGGSEFAFWTEKLGAGAPHPAGVDGAALGRVLESGAAVLPTLIAGSGMFPASRPSLVRADLLLADQAAAFIALDLSLAIQSSVALLATTARPDPKVYVEGGFRNNVPYVRFLASLLRESAVLLSDLAEATAFGAAITAVCACERAEPREIADRIRIETTAVEGAPIEGLEEYRREFLALARAFSAGARR